MRLVLCLATLLIPILLGAGAFVDPAGSTLINCQTVRLTDAFGSSAARASTFGRVALAESSASPALLPPRQAEEVLEAIQQRHGEPLPGYVGGRTFHNRERTLPPGRYREYDVHPKVPGRNRGPERVVIEQRTGKAYYTGDHYATFIPMN